MTGEPRQLCGSCDAGLPMSCTCPEPTCPRCAGRLSRDEVDVGVGVMYGPYGCPCGWSEDSRYDVTAGPKTESGYVVDQWGGLTPRATRTIRLNDDPSPRRCPRCGKAREELIGGIADSPSSIDYCRNCDPWPGEVWR